MSTNDQSTRYPKPRKQSAPLLQTCVRFQERLGLGFPSQRSNQILHVDRQTLRPALKTEPRIGKFGRSKVSRRVIRRSNSFLRHSHEIAVEFSVRVLIVEHRHRVITGSNAGEDAHPLPVFDLALRRFDRLATIDLAVIAMKTNHDNLD